MLREMKQVPGLPGSVNRQSLFITAALALVTAALFDLSQIASLGAMLYLSMDIAIHWGVIRRLRDEVEFATWIPAVAIALDVLLLVPFVIMKIRTDLFTVVATAAVAAVIFAGQWLVVRRRGGAPAHRQPSAGHS